MQARLSIASAIPGGALQADTVKSPGAASDSGSDFAIGGEDAVTGPSSQQGSASPDAWGSSGLPHLACIHVVLSALNMHLACASCKSHSCIWDVYHLACT